MFSTIFAEANNPKSNTEDILSFEVLEDTNQGGGHYSQINY